MSEQTTNFNFLWVASQLGELIPNNPDHLEWYQALCEVLPKYDITTPFRVSAFIAQCIHESMGFKVLSENLYYSADALLRVFPGYFNPDQAKQYAKNPEKIASRVYGGRMGNGPEETKEGYKFRGRGLIQLTGKNNYTKFAESCGLTIDEAVTYLTTRPGAIESACWYWDTNNLNALADRGDMITLTKRINGGTNGLSDRVKHYNHALQVFGVME